MASQRDEPPARSETASTESQTEPRSLESLPICKLAGCDLPVWLHVHSGKTEDYCRAGHAVDDNALPASKHLTGAVCELTAKVQVLTELAESIHQSSAASDTDNQAATSPLSPPATQTRRRSMSPVSRGKAECFPCRHRSRTPDADSSDGCDF